MPRPRDWVDPEERPWWKGDVYTTAVDHGDCDECRQRIEPGDSVHATTGEHETCHRRRTRNETGELHA